MGAAKRSSTQAAGESATQLAMRRHIFRVLKFHAAQRRTTSMRAEAIKMIGSGFAPTSLSAPEPDSTVRTIKDSGWFSEAQRFFEILPGYIDQVGIFCNSDPHDENESTRLRAESNYFTDRCKKISLSLKKLLDEQGEVLRSMKPYTKEATEDGSSVQRTISTALASLESHIYTLMQSLARFFDVESQNHANVHEDNTLQEMCEQIHKNSRSSHGLVDEVGLNKLWAAKRATMLFESADDDKKPSIAEVIRRCVPEEWKSEYLTYYDRLKEVFHLLGEVEKAKSYFNGETDISLMVPIENYTAVVHENEKLSSSIEDLRSRKPDVSRSYEQFQEDTARQLEQADHTLCESISKWRDAKTNSIALRKNVVKYYKLWSAKKAVSSMQEKVKQKTAFDSHSLNNSCQFSIELAKKSLDKMSSRKRAIEEENKSFQSKIACMEDKRKRIAEENVKLMAPVTSRESKHVKRRSFTTNVQSQIVNIPSCSFFG